MDNKKTINIFHPANKMIDPYNMTYYLNHELTQTMEVKPLNKQDS